jgi:hypothetical protein
MVFDISLIIGSGFGAVWEYLLLHTLFCLIPAFFIAGAMSALIPKNLLLPYLGKDSPPWIAYPIAVVSGLLLAVCSCTVLPLFAGIRKSGAGLGVAIAFLYTAPATNIMAILYTGQLIGWDIALARIFFSVLFAILVGLTIDRLMPEEKDSKSAKSPFGHKEKTDLRRLVLIFGAMLGVLLAGTRISEEVPRYIIVGIFTLATAFVSLRYFTPDERASWMTETWTFFKTILPLLLVGVFFSGILREVIPSDIVTEYMGNNSFIALLIPVLFGIFMYFPTLVEVPMARTFLDLGMAKGPLLAYLLADPVVSLPSLLVLRKVMGAKRTFLYAVLILVLTMMAGWIFGTLNG